MFKMKKRNFLISTLVTFFVLEIFFLSYFIFKYIPYVLFEKKEIDLATVVIIIILTIFSSYTFNREIYKSCREIFCKK
jgi:hypothetical protein